MNMADPMAIIMDIPKIDSGYSLEKEFAELIRTNPCDRLKVVVFLSPTNLIFID